MKQSELYATCQFDPHITDDYQRCTLIKEFEGVIFISKSIWRFPYSERC